METAFRTVSAGAIAVALILGGCGDNDGDGSVTNLGEGQATTSSTAPPGGGADMSRCNVHGGVSTPADQQIVLTLDEFTIQTTSQPPESGTIAFIAENVGEEPHEIVIVKSDNADALPKDTDGGLDEDKLPEGALVGEIEPFSAGVLCKGTFTLAAGSYVLLCNITETEPDGQKENHFEEGMHAPLTVS